MSVGATASILKKIKAKESDVHGRGESRFKLNQDFKREKSETRREIDCIMELN